MRTKAEEIQMMERWYTEAHTEPDSYLAGLMTDKFAAYIHHEIMYDRLPNICADLENAERKIDAAGEKLRTAEIELARRREQIVIACDERDKLARDLAALSLNCRQDHDKLIRENEQCLMQVQDLEREINRLKALLWDAHEMQKED